MDVDLAKIPPGNNLENTKERRTKKKAKKTASEEDETQVKDQMDDSLNISDKLRDFKQVNNESQEKLINKKLIVQPLNEDPKMDAGAMDNLSEETKDENKKKRRRKKKKDDSLDVSDKLGDLKEVNNESEENHTNKELIIQPQDEEPKMEGATENLFEENNDGKKKTRRRKIRKKAEVMNEVQCMEQMEMNGETTENLAECNMSAGSTEEVAACNVNGEKKRRRERVKKSANDTDIIQSMNLANVAMPPSDENRKTMLDKLPDNKCSAQKPQLSVGKEYATCHGDHDLNKPSSSSLNVEHDKESPLGFCNHENTVLLSNAIDVSCESHRKPHDTKIASENENHGLEQENGEIVVFQQKSAAEVSSIISTCNVGAMCSSSSDVKNEVCLVKDSAHYPRMTVVSYRRKLLVLDVNGLLANIIMPAPRDCRADAYILGRAIFKRPFCDDFLKFCFQNFDVGVWSSRSKRIIDKVVEYLLGNLKDSLLFCWDMEHSTQTGFKTLENCQKPLVFKELRNIWENNDPNHRWKKGDYDESNTLLLDDSPYKALLNPLHTAVFPRTYHYVEKNDNSLGPGGDLRVFLEGLLTSVNVRKYVEQHPFGESAINETHLSWSFYSGVLQTMSKPLQDNTASSLPTPI